MKDAVVDIHVADDASGVGHVVAECEETSFGETRDIHVEDCERIDVAGGIVVERNATCGAARCLELTVADDLDVVNLDAATPWLDKPRVHGNAIVGACKDGCGLGRAIGSKP